MLLKNGNGSKFQLHMDGLCPVGSAGTLNAAAIVMDPRCKDTIMRDQGTKSLIPGLLQAGSEGWPAKSSLAVDLSDLQSNFVITF